jgi:hypothetical protein
MATGAFVRLVPQDQLKHRNVVAQFRDLSPEIPVLCGKVTEELNAGVPVHARRLSNGPAEHRTVGERRYPKPANCAGLRLAKILPLVRALESPRTV